VPQEKLFYFITILIWNKLRWKISIWSNLTFDFGNRRRYKHGLKKQNDEEGEQLRADDHTENNDGNEIHSKEVISNPQNIFMALADIQTTRKQKETKIETNQNCMGGDTHKIFKNMSEKLIKINITWM